MTAIEQKPTPGFPAWIKGLEAAARYAGVSEKTASAWMKAGHLKVHTLSRRLHLFRPTDVDRAIELAAQSFADAVTAREVES